MPRDMHSSFAGRPHVGQAIFAVCIGWAVSFPCRAHGDGIEISWANNFLTLSASDIPGGPIQIQYLEAYCRSGSTHRNWRQTTIPHRTTLLESSRKRIRLRCLVGDAVEVEHNIVAGDDAVDFRLVAANVGKEFVDVQWAQPCMRVDRFTGAQQADYFKQCFVVLDRGPTFLHNTRRTNRALYVPGQVYVPAGIDRNDVNPRPLSPEIPIHNLIGAVSANGRKIVAMAWDQTQELFQGVAVCVHADFRIGGLKPGETKRLHGKVYLVPNELERLIQRYRADFRAQGD